MRGGARHRIAPSWRSSVLVWITMGGTRLAVMLGTAAAPLAEQHGFLKQLPPGALGGSP